VPAVPTVTYLLLAYIIDNKVFSVPDVLIVQIIPSPEVRILPEKPTATYWLLPYVI